MRITSRFNRKPVLRSEGFCTCWKVLVKWEIGEQEELKNSSLMSWVVVWKAALNRVHYKERILLCFLTRIWFAKWFLNSTGGLVSSPWFKRMYKQYHLNSKYAQAVFWFHWKNLRTRQNRWCWSPFLKLILAVLISLERVRGLRGKTDLMFSCFLFFF